jgi:hypothetical protein
LSSINQEAAPDQLIIVIARLGDGDIRRNLNWRRLHNVRAYWTKFLEGEYRRKPETVILAEGERVSGYGQLEFYIGGKLIEVLSIHRNRDLITGVCYPLYDRHMRNGAFYFCDVEDNQIFYPCRERGAPRRSRR